MASSSMSRRASADGHGSPRMCSFSASPLPTPSTNRPSSSTAAVAAAWATIAGWMRTSGRSPPCVIGSGSPATGAEHAPDEGALALLVVPRVEVVGDPQRLEAGLLGAPSLVEQLAGPNSSLDRKYPYLVMPARAPAGVPSCLPAARPCPERARRAARRRCPQDVGRRRSPGPASPAGRAAGAPCRPHRRAPRGAQVVAAPRWAVAEGARDTQGGRVVRPGRRDRVLGVQLGRTPGRAPPRASRVHTPAAAAGTSHDAVDGAQLGEVGPLQHLRPDELTRRGGR